MEAAEVVLAMLKPEKLDPVVELRPTNLKPAFVPAVEAVAWPNGVLKVDPVVEAPNGLIAENPPAPRVPLPKLLVPRVGVPNPVEVAPLPKEKPVEPLPKIPPVVAAAILLAFDDNSICDKSQSKHLF